MDESGGAVATENDNDMECDAGNRLKLLCLCPMIYA